MLPVKVWYDSGDLLRPGHIALPDLDPGGGGGLGHPLARAQLGQGGADLQWRNRINLQRHTVSSAASV